MIIRIERKTNQEVMQDFENTVCTLPQNPITDFYWDTDGTPVITSSIDLPEECLAKLLAYFSQGSAYKWVTS